MPITTQGLISVTPIRVHTTAPLGVLAVAAAENRYSGVAPGRGWGSVKDGNEELLGRPVQARPKGGRAEYLEESELYPPQFRARFYWDEPDKTMLRALGELGDPSLINKLEAADVSFAETDLENVYLGLVTTRNERQLMGEVIPAIRDLFNELDEKSHVQVDDNPLSFGDSDIFRWLIHRAEANGDLSSDLMLIQVRAIHCRDLHRRQSALTDGADLDRPELLALLSSPNTHFGPGKITLYQESIELGVDLELHEDGGFAVFRGRSEYDDEEDLSSEDKGLKLLQDVAYHVIPSLKEAYSLDADWRATGRDLFIEQARASLAASLQRP